MSALSVNDIIGWLLFTLVLGFFTQASLEATKVILILTATIGFTVFCLTIGRHFANSVISKIKEKQLPQPGTSLTFICLLGLICGAITQKIGIHALFGFFIAGIMAGGARALSEKTRQVISQMVYAIFVPLFFANIGLKVDFVKNFDIFLVLLICVIGISGRFFGAWFGVNLTKLSRVNRLPIAVAHTPGGAMEIVVGVLALEYRLITEPVFVAIVFGAIFSSVILGPWLSHSIKRRKEVSIFEFFSQRAVITNLKALNRDEAIEKLCEVASEQADMPEAESIFSDVIKRENEMGTAIEEGIAVPHARMASLKKAIVVFGKSVSGIDWNSPDGKPTQFVFLILTPKEDIETQVQILSLIARGMSDKATRKDIIQAKEPHEIWEILRKAFTAQRIIKE
jgi:fructose-specific phosphotransferase system IIA component